MMHDLLKNTEKVIHLIAGSTEVFSGRRLNKDDFSGSVTFIFFL